MSPLEVRRLDRPERWAVGGVDGLALQVTVTGARSWVLRVTVAGKQREIGLGSFPAVTLASARERAREHRDAARQGVDPVAARRAAVNAATAERSAQQTFADVAKLYITQHAGSWKNAKHESQWTATLRTCADPVVGAMLVRDIFVAHIIKILAPIWATKTETATRVRSRVELVLDFAAARGLREGPNPARWKGNLDAALPRVSRVAKVEHHAALALQDVGPFMQRLRGMQGVGARALEFAILTAVRSGEVRGATWSELDVDGALWIVPAARMKAGREHRIPLSGPAVQLLRRMPVGVSDGLLFPGTKGPLSDMSLSAVLQRAAREFAQIERADHKYVMVLHDHQANPHVHISVRAESKHGKRLNPRKADLHRWRETFAEKLRGYGVEAEATRQATRGCNRNFDPLWRLKAREDGRLRTHRSGAKSGARAQATRAEAVEAWMHVGRALAMSGDPADRDLARFIAASIKEMPATQAQDPQRQVPEVTPQPKLMDIGGPQR